MGAGGSLPANTLGELIFCLYASYSMKLNYLGSINVTFVILNITVIVFQNLELP